MQKSALVRDSSSATIAMSIALPPSPPYSSGNGIESSPALTHSAYSASG
jgi:hypothetical protein